MIVIDILGKSNLISHFASAHALGNKIELISVQGFSIGVGGNRDISFAFGRADINTICFFADIDYLAQAFGIIFQGNLYFTLID